MQQMILLFVVCFVGTSIGSLNNVCCSNMIIHNNKEIVQVPRVVSNIREIEQNGVISSSTNVPNFLLRRTLNDGEEVTYVHWHGRWSQETVNKPHNIESHRGAIRLVQSTNGHHLVTNIYDTISNQLVDCDIVNDMSTIDMFLRDFQQATVPVLNNIDMYTNNNTHFTYINDVRDARNTPLLYYGQLKHECRLWHAQHKVDTHVVDEDDNDVVQHQRHKRSILISPGLLYTNTHKYHHTYVCLIGTQWCGSGARAADASDLGENSETDQCCREHDGCPYIIEGLSTRYGYFNYRFYTMSYCECDRKSVCCK
jgi:hypothetical protein